MADYRVRSREGVKWAKRMSIYKPYDNNMRDMPIYRTEEAILKSGFQREAIIPAHFTVGKVKNISNDKESENNNG